MKKIFASMLCLGLAGAVVLSACGKKAVKKENEEVVVENEVVEETVTIEVPSSQLDYEFEINTFDMTAKITAYLGEDSEVIVPDTITDPVYGDVVPVTVIGTYAFAENEAIEAVALPETVTDIEKGAFQSCPNLCAVSLPASLEVIEANAFYNSNKIDKLGMLPYPVAVAEEVEETQETAEGEEAAEEAVEEEKAPLYDAIGNEFPSTVSEIGFMAFSSQLNEIAWYSALKDTAVVVGDGILLKYNGNGDYTLTQDIKSVAYYAFSNVGAVKITVENGELELDDNAVFMSDKALTFSVPEGAEDLASAVKANGALYEFYEVEVPEEEAAETEETAEGEEAATEEVAE